MAHADIFERISRQDVVNKKADFVSRPETIKEPIVEKKAIETIKLLGKQILEIREIMEQQSKTIKTLQSEVISLRKKGEDTEGNVKLTMIDQKDVNNQLRALRAAVSSHEYVDSRMPSREAYNPRPAQQPVYQQAMPQVPVRQQQPALRPAQPQRAVQQPVPQPVSRAVQEVRSAVQSQAQASTANRAGAAASPAEMNVAYEEITTAINQARSQLGLEPHADLLGSVARPDKVYPSRQAENVAKEFIFGRIPKMLNLS